MPIIIDNSLLQQPSEEPDEPNALEMGVLGLVEGIKAGYDKQQEQAAEQQAFDREKGFQLEKMQREQTFQTTLEDKRMAAEKPLLDAQLAREKLLGRKAEMEIQAEKNAALVLREESLSRIRNTYAEAFGDGDAAKGGEALKLLEEGIIQADDGTPEGQNKATALLTALNRTAERKKFEYDSRKANEYVDKVSTSPLFSTNPGVMFQVENIRADTSLNSLQKAEKIRGLEKQAFDANTVATRRNQFITQTQNEMDALSVKMSATEDPFEDAQLQAQIDNIAMLQGRVQLIGESDVDGLDKFIDESRKVFFTSPRDALAGKAMGGTGKKEDPLEAGKNLLGVLGEFAASGAIPEDQLAVAYTKLFQQMGLTASQQPEGGAQNEALAIREALMGEGGADKAASLDTSNLTMDERKAYVKRIDAQEKYKGGLTPGESQLRDSLSASIRTEEAGAKKIEDIKSSSAAQDEALKGIKLPDRVVQNYGQAGKFSLSRVSNKQDAEYVLGHLEDLTSAYQQSAGASIQELRKLRESIKTVKQMISNNVFPGATAKRQGAPGEAMKAGPAVDGQQPAPKANAPFYPTPTGKYPPNSGLGA